MEKFLIMYFILLWFHFLYDFHIQGEFVGVQKSKSDFILAVHCFTWTGFISIPLYFFGTLAVWKIVMLFVGHFVIDRWKCRHDLNSIHGLTGLLYIDQTLHAIQLGVCLL